MEKRFIPINHLEAHILSGFFNNKITFPHLSLLLTGGHTQMYFLININEISLIGETVDVAVGEAFDKVAKILGLPYPGGPEIEKLAINGNAQRFKFPQPLKGRNNCDFSFSGLKTSVRQTAEKISSLSKNALLFSLAVSTSKPDKSTFDEIIFKLSIFVS